MSTIPVIDDEPAIGEILRDHLDMEEYDVRTDRDGESGLEPNVAAIVCEACVGSVQRSARGYFDERAGQYYSQVDRARATWLRSIARGAPGGSRSRVSASMSCAGPGSPRVSESVARVRTTDGPARRVHVADLNA